MKFILIVLIGIFYSVCCHEFTEDNFTEYDVTAASKVDSVGSLIAFTGEIYGISFIDISDKKPYITFYNKDGSATVPIKKISESSDSSNYIVTRSC